MYTNTSRSPLGANWDTREKIHIHTNSDAWVKYVVVALLAVAIRFLCCG